jgi:hypothetical protein
MKLRLTLPSTAQVFRTRGLLNHPQQTKGQRSTEPVVLISRQEVGLIGDMLVMIDNLIGQTGDN